MYMYNTVIVCTKKEVKKGNSMQPQFNVEYIRNQRQKTENEMTTQMCTYIALLCEKKSLLMDFSVVQFGRKKKSSHKYISEVTYTIRKRNKKKIIFYTAIFISIMKRVAHIFFCLSTAPLLRADYVKSSHSRFINDLCFIFNTDWDSCRLYQFQVLRNVLKMYFLWLDFIWGIPLDKRVQSNLPWFWDHKWMSIFCAKAIEDFDMFAELHFWAPKTRLNNICISVEWKVRFLLRSQCGIALSKVKCIRKKWPCGYKEHASRFRKKRIRLSTCYNRADWFWLIARENILMNCVSGLLTRNFNIKVSHENECYFQIETVSVAGQRILQLQTLWFNHIWYLFNCYVCL